MEAQQNSKPKRQFTSEQKQRKNQLDKLYYQKNREKINQMNILNHKNKPEILENIKAFRLQKCRCNVCNNEMIISTFYNHKKTKKHIKNLEGKTPNLDSYSIIEPTTSSL